MENEIVGRLYYNRNKSHSYNNLGIGMPLTTKNKKTLFSPMKENQINEDELYKTTKNDNAFELNLMTTQPNNFKKNSLPLINSPKKNDLNDFNAFLEKLSKYENKKSLKK